MNIQTKKIYSLYCLLEILGVILIILIAAYLRLWNIDTNPGFYNDEGTIIEISRHILSGKNQYFGVNHSTLLAGRLPLFPIILAFIFHLIGEGILPLRIFTGLLGTFSCILLYLSVRKEGGKYGNYLGMLAAFLLAVNPKAILYSRIGMSYNLLTPIVIGLTWFLWRYFKDGKKKNLGGAILLFGIGSISDLMAVSLLPWICFVILLRNWRDLVWALPISLIPFSFFCLVQGLVNPEGFLYDLSFTLHRGNGVAFPEQLVSIVLNYTYLLLQDSWILVGMVGFFMFRPNRIRLFIITGFLIPTFFMSRTLFLSGLGAYYITPLLPFVALGTAYFLIIAIRQITEMVRYLIPDDFFRNRWFKFHDASLIAICNIAIVFILVISPLLIHTSVSVLQATNQISPTIDHVFPTNIAQVLLKVEDARTVADYVNQNTQQDDLVIASPALGWLIKSQVTDYQISAATQGPTIHFPQIPPNRLEFSVDFQKARFIIVDPIWMNLAEKEIPILQKVRDELETEWQVRFEAGKIVVYENPKSSHLK